jgi:hypothetical protein
MKTTTIRKGLFLLALISGACAIGCELIVDFDRTRIPVDTTEASTNDAAGLVDTGSPDAVADAAPEATTDADASPSDASDAADAPDSDQ